MQWTQYGEQDQEQEGSSAQETQIFEITLASLYESIKNMSEAFNIRLTTIETQQSHFERRQERNLWSVSKIQQPSTIEKDKNVNTINYLSSIIRGPAKPDTF